VPGPHSSKHLSYKNQNIAKHQQQRQKSNGSCAAIRTAKIDERARMALSVAAVAAVEILAATLFKPF
jgi:hypothetical protein